MLMQLAPAILRPLSKEDEERTHFAAALQTGDAIDAFAGGLGDQKLSRYIELQLREWNHYRAKAGLEQDHRRNIQRAMEQDLEFLDYIGTCRTEVLSLFVVRRTECLRFAGGRPEPA